MALRQITQEEVDNRLLSHSHSGRVLTYNEEEEEERENFMIPPNNIMRNFVDPLFDPPRHFTDYDETEDSVSGLSYLYFDDLYEILESHFHGETEDQLNSYVDYLYRQELDWAANKRDGLPEEIISQFVRSRTCHDGDLLDICVVCQSEYERGEILGRLECGHEYHASCIRRWLTEKNACPVCKREAIRHYQ